jgi:hypothetical protein
MTHILILVTIIALLIVVAEHSRLASRVKAAEAKLKSVDTKIAAALKNDAKTVVADVKTAESELAKAL